MTTRRDAPLLAALALLVAACGDDPTTPDPAATLRLCSDADFVAFQDEQGRWTPLRGDDGVYAFRAPPRLGLAFAWPERTLPYLVVHYLTASQAAAQHPCGTTPAAVEPTVQGVVTGRDGDGRQIELAHGSTRVFLVQAESTFRLRPTAEPRDLVAARMGAGSGTAWVADRVILRRGLALAPDARVTLDFGSDEAFAPEPRTVFFTGGYGYVGLWFAARGGAEVTIATAGAGERGDPETDHVLALGAVPLHRTMPGDLHHLLLMDDDRELHLWRRDLGDFALRHGEPLAQPSFVRAGTSPYVRLDATLPAQPDYGGAVMLYYDQAHPLNSSVLLTMTREYAGDASGAWRVPMPDLTGVAGFPAIVGLEPAPVRWTAWATSRRGPWFQVGRVPADGDAHREATTTGVVP